MSTQKKSTNDIVIVDVGCRWGFADTWMELLPQARIYGFDPDIDECERLRLRYNDPNIILVPQALAETSGLHTLYLTQNLACSSLYQPISELTSAVTELECATKVDTTKVEVTTLDLWSTLAGVDRIDFIKLDTQGSELDILRGGVGILQTIRVIEIEVEFNPIYENQPLFGDVDKFLREQGFELWRLSNMVHYSRKDSNHQYQASDVSYYDSKPMQHPTLGGQLYWGHAHYIRKKIINGESFNDQQQCARDAVILKKLGFDDLAFRLSSNKN
ncbi:MAG: FkbM family methyltransferase [Methylophilus sp.]|jgi:FkbM family methyltransferase